MKNREKDIFGERRGNGAGGTLQKLTELTEITKQSFFFAKSLL